MSGQAEQVVAWSCRIERLDADTEARCTAWDCTEPAFAEVTTTFSDEEEVADDLCMACLAADLPAIFGLVPS